MTELRQAGKNKIESSVLKTVLKAGIILSPALLSLTAEPAHAGNFLPLTNLLNNGPFTFPIEIGQGLIPTFIENCVNKPIDMMASMGIVGGIIGAIRLGFQIPAINRQLKANSENEINYTAVASKIGGLFYSTIAQEGLQWVRVPMLIATSYWLTQLADMAPADLTPMFRTLALISQGITFMSAIEALNPFQ